MKPSQLGQIRPSFLFWSKHPDDTPSLLRDADRVSRLERILKAQAL
jgi:hypothetical protein